MLIKSEFIKREIKRVFVAFGGCILALHIWFSGFSFGSSSFEIYGGYQTSPHSVVSGWQVNDNIRSPFKFNAGWLGKSFSMPPYYGYRFTKWTDKSGWGFDFTHSKAYADETTLNESNLNILEFTDGLNNLTFHRQHELKEYSNHLISYLGYGIGVCIPHVEFQKDESSPLTFGYQLGGPTLAFNTGLKYLVDDGKYIFSEYKFTASWLDVELNVGGRLETILLTNALNIGFGLSF